MESKEYTEELELRIKKLTSERDNLAEELALVKGMFEDVNTKSIVVSNICHGLAYNSRNTEGILEHIDKLKLSISKLRNSFSFPTTERLKQLQFYTLKNAINYCNKYEAFPVKRGKEADLVIAVDEIEEYAINKLSL